MERRLYFAYGSNMDAAQMACRCPEAVFLSTARLPRYRFLINARGVATIVRDPKSDVYGVIWSITPDDERNLDRCEGVAKGLYCKHEIEVESTEGYCSALTYIATNNDPGRPREGYLEKVVAAAIKNRLPNKYIEYLRSQHSPSDPGGSHREVTT